MAISSIWLCISRKCPRIDECHWWIDKKSSKDPNRRNKKKNHASTCYDTIGTNKQGEKLPINFEGATAPLSKLLIDEYFLP